MNIDFQELEYLKNPSNVTLKGDFYQFLLSLDVPTVIDISGKDSTKTRVVTTLIHGNEPSGLIAIHRWLTKDKEAPKPETNIRFVIASVEAANASPTLSNRYLKGGLDLNRCFGSDLNHSYFLRANTIERAIREVNPEVVVDLHNTSGSGPAFAVSPLISTQSLALASLFCDTAILSDIRLGALMEQNFDCPIITVECGGANDEQAHEVAYEGIVELASSPCLDMSQQHNCVDIIYKPLRLKLTPNAQLHYANQDEGLAGVTLCENIEQFNYGPVRKGQMLGWLDQHGLDNLQLTNDANENLVKQFFTVRDSQLVSICYMRIFMATRVKDIASNDCLFYIVKMPTTSALQ